MSFDQERTGKDDPDAARDDTPPAFSLEKRTAPRDTPPADTPPADMPPADATPADAKPADGESADAPPVDDAPAAAVPQPANPWAAPTAPPAPGAPVGAVPGGAPAANPWVPAGVQQPWGNGAFPPQSGMPGVPGQPLPPGTPGYVSYPQPDRSLYTNGLAIAALVVGLLCCVGFIGIGLGIGALNQIKRTGERGKGLAISGIVAGSVWLLIMALALVNGSFDADVRTSGGSGGSKPTPTHSATTSSGSALRLNVGQCFNLGVGVSAKTVDCSALHEGEVYWTGRSSYASGDFPGQDKLTAEADRACLEHVDEYVMDTWTLSDSVNYQYVYPDRLSWKAAGGRLIVCFLAEEGRSTGSLRKDGTTLTTDQRHLLEATNQFDRAWNKGPDEDVDVEDDPAAYRTWAGELATAASKQATMLDAAGWPAAEQSTVKRLVAESRQAAEHFRAASTATDPAAVRAELKSGYQHLGDDLILDLRRTLGLATQDEEPKKHPSDQTV